MDKEKIKAIMDTVRTDLADKGVVIRVAFAAIEKALLDEPADEPEEKPEPPIKVEQDYCFMKDDGRISYSTWYGDAKDLGRLAMGNVFLATEAAEAHRDWLKNQQALMVESHKAGGGEWGAFWEDGLRYFLAYGVPSIPKFPSTQSLEPAYHNVLKNRDAIKAHLTYKSGAVMWDGKQHV